MPDRHQIPTHLGVQDRFFYGLSMPQLMVLLLGSSSAWAAWHEWPGMPAGLRDGAAAVALLLTLAFALVQPAERSLLVWALVLLRYVATPKRCVWRPQAPHSGACRPGGPAFAPLAPCLDWATSPNRTEVRR